jgi:hypothetical protein
MKKVLYLLFAVLLITVVACQTPNTGTDTGSDSTAVDTTVADTTSTPVDTTVTVTPTDSVAADSTL